MYYRQTCQPYRAMVRDATKDGGRQAYDIRPFHHVLSFRLQPAEPAAETCVSFCERKRCTDSVSGDCYPTESGPSAPWVFVPPLNGISAYLVDDKMAEVQSPSRSNNAGLSAQKTMMLPRLSSPCTATKLPSISSSNFTRRPVSI